MDSKIITQHYIITGLVQMVGYRYFVWRLSVRLGFVGWVRNLPDGSVEATISAPAALHEEILLELHRGPASARVEGINVSPLETQNFSIFEILH